MGEEEIMKTDVRMEQRSCSAEVHRSCASDIINIANEDNKLGEKQV